MADFSTSYFNYIKPNEGFYANLTGDTGGQTYGGIARNYNPSWEGWSLVDSYIQQNGQPRNNQQIPEADPYVTTFYQNLWNKNLIGQIANQDIANIFFDFIVNSGSNIAVKHIQKIVGTTADGVMGNKTLSAINAYNPTILFQAIKDDRANFYNTLAANNPNDQNFLQGWMNRLATFTAANPVGTSIGLGVFLLVVVAFTFLTLTTKVSG